MARCVMDDAFVIAMSSVLMASADACAKFVKLVDIRYYHEFDSSFIWRDRETREASIADMRSVRASISSE